MTAFTKEEKIIRLWSRDLLSRHDPEITRELQHFTREKFIQYQEHFEVQPFMFDQENWVDHRNQICNALGRLDYATVSSILQKEISRAQSQREKPEKTVSSASVEANTPKVGVKKMMRLRDLTPELFREQYAAMDALLSTLNSRYNSSFLEKAKASLGDLPSVHDTAKMILGTIPYQQKLKNAATHLVTHLRTAARHLESESPNFSDPDLTQALELAENWNAMFTKVKIVR
jgi:hypothetical protein